MGFYIPDIPLLHGSSVALHCGVVVSMKTPPKTLSPFLPFAFLKQSAVCLKCLDVISAG